MDYAFAVKTFYVGYAAERQLFSYAHPFCSATVASSPLPVSRSSRRTSLSKRIGFAKKAGCTLHIRVMHPVAVLYKEHCSADKAALSEF